MDINLEADTATQSDFSEFFNISKTYGQEVAARLKGTLPVGLSLSSEGVLTALEDSVFLQSLLALADVVPINYRAFLVR